MTAIFYSQPEWDVARFHTSSKSNWGLRKDCSVIMTLSVFPSCQLKPLTHRRDTSALNHIPPPVSSSTSPSLHISRMRLDHVWIYDVTNSWGNFCNSNFRLWFSAFWPCHLCYQAFGHYLSTLNQVDSARKNFTCFKSLSYKWNPNPWVQISK